MKKATYLLLALMLFGILGAIDIDYSGEFRTRAAMFNDPAEINGSRIDHRLHLGLDSELAEGLNFHALFEVGDVTWGEVYNGLNASGINIEINELYIDYLIEAINTKATIGQQYWADHRGLILDDYFTGLRLSNDNLFGLQAELALMKFLMDEEYLPDGDDMITLYHKKNVLMASLFTEKPLPIGVLAMTGLLKNEEIENFTVMPYVTLDYGPACLDVAGFFDMQFNDPEADTNGSGVSAKADLNLGLFKLGGDILFATKHGLTTLSPWYQNGLYIYGIGAYHDGLNLYWNTPYSGNEKNFTSMVGKLTVPLHERITAFSAGGFLSDLGFEVNGGFNYSVVEDLFNVQAYGAFGTHDTNEITNYAIGTTLIVNF